MNDTTPGAGRDDAASAERRYVLWFAAGCAVVVAAGILLRIRHLDEIFDFDELWVSLFLREGGLTIGQTTIPLLYFVTAKGVSSLFGYGEAVLRSPALVCGVLLFAVPIAAGVLRQVRRMEALAWLALLAFSSPLVFYAARVKQYSMEALFCAVLLVWWLRLIDEEASPARLWPFFAFAGIGVMGLHGPVFVMAASAAGSIPLLMRGWQEKTRNENLRRIGPWTAGYAAVGVCFLLAYAAWIRVPDVIPYPAALARYRVEWEELAVFWNTEFSDGSLQFLVRHGRVVTGELLNLARFGWAVAIAGIAVWTAKSLRADWRRTFAVLSICGGPFVLTLLASWLTLYPFGETRLLLFAAPGFYLLTALGLCSLLSPLRGVLPAALLVCLLAVYAVAQIDNEPYRQYLHVIDIEKEVAYLAVHHRPGEPLVCAGVAGLPLVFRFPDMPQPLLGETKVRESALRASERFWVLREAREPDFSFGGYDREVVVSSASASLERWTRRVR